MAGAWAGRPRNRVSIPGRVRDFFFSEALKWTLESTQSSFNRYWGFLSQEQSIREVNQTTQLYLLPPYALMLCTERFYFLTR